LHYVQVTAGYDHSAALRSDGSIVAWGRPSFRTHDVPAPAPGQRYLEVVAGDGLLVARTGSPATYVTFGPGCAGSLGVPSLVPLGLPRLGATLERTVTKVSFRSAVLLLGTSRTTWAGAPLPLALNFVGMPGCELRVSVDLKIPITGNGAFVGHTLAIPDLVHLLGLAFYEQAIVFDLAVNQANLVLSDAAEAVIGR
jgi:hypothetical protein